MHRIIAISAAAFALVLSLAPFPAAATDLPAGGLTRPEVVSWLQRHGVAARVDHDNVANDDYVAAATGGINYGIYFYGCKNSRCDSIQYSAGWSGANNVSDAKLLQWNREKRYLRAYRAQAGGVFAEYDIDVSPGGSWEELDYSLTRWTNRIADFKTYMGL